MTRKFILKFSMPFLLITPLATTISCSLFGGVTNGQRSDLEFYNYQDYIDQAGENGINKFYHFSTYGDLPEFETYLKAERSVGGIASDYFNAKLAQKKLIQKLDLSLIFDLPADRSKWASELESIYTPEIWKTLTSFDSIIGDADGDGVNDHLWEYSIPYFNQNKVIAFNINAITNPSALGNINLNDPLAIQNWFTSNTNLSYQAIFEKLIAAGALNITINDYMRDNMMIGSETLALEANPGSQNFTTTGVVNSEKEGKDQIDAFSRMLNNLSFNKKIWTTNGTDALENIVTQADQKRTSDIALIYNGDAMAAYYGGYNSGSKNKEIRIVIPKNSTFITDGIVMSSIIANDFNEQARFYQTVKNYLTKGAQTQGIDQEGKIYDGYEGSWNRVWNNFVYNAYTPVYQNVYKYMETNFFEDDIDQMILSATRIAATGNLDSSGEVVNISSNTLAWPISDNLQIVLQNHYNHIKK